jgi:hypothetical protein
MIIDHCQECQRLWDAYRENVQAARYVRAEREVQAINNEGNRYLDRDLNVLEQQQDELRNMLAAHQKQEHRRHLFKPVLVARANHQ